MPNPLLLPDAAMPPSRVASNGLAASPPRPPLSPADAAAVSASPRKQVISAANDRDSLAAASDAQRLMPFPEVQAPVLEAAEAVCCAFLHALYVY